MNQKVNDSFGNATSSNRCSKNVHRSTSEQKISQVYILPTLDIHILVLVYPVVADFQKHPVSRAGTMEK